MRPLQLRQPMQQQQHQQQHPRPLQMPQPPRILRPNIPTLQVTVPPPPVAATTASSTPSNGPPSSPYAQYPRQPVGLGNNGMPYPPSSPRSASPFSSSSDTLIGSVGSSSEKKPLYHSSHHTPPSPAFAAARSPPMSPSIKNLQLVVPFEDKTAHPDNDRLSPATPGLNGQRDWWKRFSTVVRENQQQELMAEKVNGKGGARTPGSSPVNGASNKNKPRSQWLDNEGSNQRKYRIWVGVVAFLIIAGIAGALAYHFVTKNPDAGETLPGKKDFGLGTLSDSGSSTAYARAAKTSSAAAAADGSDSQATSAMNTLPAPSAVAAGATLDRRRSLLIATAMPVPVVPVVMVPSAHGQEKRRIPGGVHAYAAADRWKLD